MTILAITRPTLLATLPYLAFALPALSQDLAPSEPRFRFEPIQGEAFEARIRSVSPEGSLVLSVLGAEERTVQVGELFKLTRLDPPPVTIPPREGRLFLSGGDRISSRLLRFDDQFAYARSLSLGNLKIPLDLVIGFLAEPPGQRATPTTPSERLDSLLFEPRESDLVLLTNGDRLNGSILRIDEDVLLLQQEQAETRLERSQVQGLGLDPALLNQPKDIGPHLEIHLADGSRLSGSPRGFQQGKLILETRFGPSVECPTDQILLGYLVGGRITYLSEVEPAGAEYVEYIGPIPPYQTDHNVLGRPLRVRGMTFEKGIGMQSRTLLAYRLDGSARRFQAQVALDDDAGPWASVVFKVLLDGRLAFESPLLRAGDPPVMIDLPLEQARFLILTSDFGTNGNVQDYADWLEPRLIK